MSGWCCRTEPTQQSEEYDHLVGITVDGVHGSTVVLKAIAVSVDSNKEKVVTGHAEASFEVVASLPQQAQDQLVLIKKSIRAGITAARQTDQWVPVAWSKVHRDRLGWCDRRCRWVTPSGSMKRPRH